MKYDVDVLMKTTIKVEAENEIEAKAIAGFTINEYGLFADDSTEIELIARSSPLGVDSVVRTVIEKNDYPIAVYEGVPINETSEKSDDLFACGEYIGENFDKFPAPKISCVSGGFTTIDIDFIDENGELIQSVKNAGVERHVNAFLLQGKIYNFEFNEVNMDRVAVAVVFNISRFGGKSEYKRLMFLSKAFTIREISRIRSESLSFKKEKRMMERLALLSGVIS